MNTYNKPVKAAPVVVENVAEKNMPVFKTKVGACDIAVWEQKTDKGSFLTVSTSRSYKDKNGEWKKTNNLKINDIPSMILGLQEAYKFAKLKGFTDGGEE